RGVVRAGRAAARCRRPSGRPGVGGERVVDDDAGVRDQGGDGPGVRSRGRAPRCEQVAQLLDPDALPAGLEWAVSALSTTTLVSEIKEATGRVSDLVATVKSDSRTERG